MDWGEEMIAPISLPVDKGDWGYSVKLAMAFLIIKIHSSAFPSLEADKTTYILVMKS